MTRRGFKFFKAVVATGFALGVVLLVEGTFTYRYVTRHLIRDHLTWQAGQHLSSLQSRMRSLKIETPEQFLPLIDEICEERPGEIAWIRVADASGRLLAQTSGTSGRDFARSDIETMQKQPNHNRSEVRSTPAGDVLAVVMVLPLPLGHQREMAADGPHVLGRSSFYVVEIAMAMGGPNDLFRALRNNLAVSSGAAVALLLTMAVVFARLPGYLRGRELEEQLALARTVQQRLLPTQGRHHDQLDFAATCLPAFQVGGDYFDVFPAQHGQVALVLADVSGKGLPASLLMAHLHGAVRTVAALDDGVELGAGAEHLNQLLSEVTSRERFASLFWAYYSPQEQRLRYVNAGHLAPMVVRRRLAGGFECHRLDRGGPVLGLLPQAVYEQGEFTVCRQDLVVLYSDGLAEATDRTGLEFGDDRLLATVEANWERPVTEIQQAILCEVKRFIGDCELKDDLTVLVARVEDA